MTDVPHLTDATPFPQDRTCPYHPPAGYDPLRSSRPLARIKLFDGRPAWLVTGHSAARALLADPRLSTDRTDPGYPATNPRLAALRQKSVTPRGVDDPGHHRVERRKVIPGFSVNRAAGLKSRIQQIVDELIDAMIERGPTAELVSAFALPVPSMVICEVLGVPYDDHEFFELQSRRLLRGPTVADSMDAREQLEKYLGDLVDRKQHEPGSGVPGMLDDLVHERLRDGTYDRTELVTFAVVLLVAGHESTANMISLGVYTLLEHPKQLDEVRQDPALLPAAIEELLRMLAVSDGLLRVATEDVEVEGTTIRTGEGVVFATSLINRDESVYDAPDVLDWHRPVRHHLTFGFGMHQCLGQNIARVELEIALGTLLRRLPDLRLAVPAEEIPCKPGDTIQGLLELPVTW
uniref:Putative cytochrome P450 hydroxylase n=1 Tax=Streptomyces versipellis TaxID=67375 RepID=A0A0B6VJI1_9ACTN|nr:putative cytochrome P450 hydroxylase [Streptomyces versipellis]